jgi:lysozyme
MIINKATVDLVKEFEGFEARAYKCPAGVWTIGYGTTAAAGVGIVPVDGMTITATEAEGYLQDALSKFSNAISMEISAPINENEYGAFVSLAYNIGPGAFKKSSALRHFNAGNKAAAADAMLLWNKAGGKVLAGLVRRRAAERALFLTPVGATTQPAIRDTRIVPDAPRESAAQSTTVQASAVQIVSGAGAGVAAVATLDGHAQIVALAFAGVITLAALWILRQRLRSWADGDR